MKLLLVDEQTLEATGRVWTEQLSTSNSDVPPSRYQQWLSWSRGYLRGEWDKGAYSYALVRDGEEHACALLELTHAGRANHGAVKILRLIVEPALDIALQDGENSSLRELGLIAAHILIESIELTFDQLPANEMKVWGATPLTVEFLEGLAVNMGNGSLKISSHGNWLVFKW